MDALFGAPDQPIRPPPPPPPPPPLPPPPAPQRAPSPRPPPPALRPAAIARAKAKADLKAAEAAQAQERKAAQPFETGSELPRERSQIGGDGGDEHTQSERFQQNDDPSSPSSPPPIDLAMSIATPPSVAQPPVLFAVLYYLGAVLLCASLMGALAIHVPSEKMKLDVVSSLMASTGLCRSWVSSHQLPPSLPSHQTSHATTCIQGGRKMGKRKEERAEERVSLISQEEPAAMLPVDDGRACSVVTTAEARRTSIVLPAEELSRARSRSGPPKSAGRAAAGASRAMQSGCGGYGRSRDEQAESNLIATKVSRATSAHRTKPAPHCGLTMD